MGGVFAKKAPACQHAADQGFSNVALIGSKPHPRWIKSVLPLWRSRAKAATRSCTLFWGGEGKRKKTF